MIVFLHSNQKFIFHIHLIFIFILKKDGIKKDELYLNYKKGIFLSIFSVLSLFFIFYIYSRDASPGNSTIFITHSLYFFAEVVLFVFFVCISIILIGIKRAFFSTKYYELNPSKLIYYIQTSLKSRNYKILFILIIAIYFVFFGFLSNFFVFFNNDGTVFSNFLVISMIK